MRIHSFSNVNVCLYATTFFACKETCGSIPAHHFYKNCRITSVMAKQNWIIKHQVDVEPPPSQPTPPKDNHINDHIGAMAVKCMA